jgi:NAD(P)-dependent dehydrogenase (short-subunit alcohol dehydrogenase family)
MENTKIIQGKVLLATGASRRIGQAISREAAMQGAMVAFTYLSSIEQGRALEAELAALGSKARGYRSDASDFTQAEQLIKTLLADFGTLDVLANNTGIIGFSKSEKVASVLAFHAFDKSSYISGQVMKKNGVENT